MAPAGTERAPEGAVALFDRAAAGGGQLLRVERLADPGGSDSAALVFTFDVGRIQVTADGRGLRGDHLASREDLPTGLVDAGEEEPWWRFMGQPVTRVSALEQGGLDLQFRHDDQNPRIVRLTSVGGGVGAHLLG